MEIKEERLLDVLGAPGVKFAIPRFQRAYSWQVEQCDELWRDLMRAARAGRTHFIGTLIYLEEDEGGNATRFVVDGQQRLTTLTLLLVALARHLSERGETLFGLGPEDIARDYLRFGGGAKLALSRADRTTLEAVVTDGPLPDRPAQRVVDNLTRFQAKMEDPGFDALALWRVLGNLTAIVSQLDSRAQAPNVFESFNSKGVPLTTADLVRNYLLMAENHREQTRLYETFWEPISGVFGDDPGSLRLNGAILGWLSVRFRQVRKFGDSQAFSIFKSFCEDEYDGTVDELLDELYSFCMVWAENYRYHAVKKYKTADWARLGRKTRVSERERAPLDNPESREYYRLHFGVDPRW